MTAMLKGYTTTCGLLTQQGVCCASNTAISTMDLHPLAMRDHNAQRELLPQRRYPLPYAARVLCQSDMVGRANPHIAVASGSSDLSAEMRHPSRYRRLAQDVLACAMHYAHVAMPIAYSEEEMTCFIIIVSLLFDYLYACCQCILGSLWSCQEYTVKTAPLS
ncbi:hypothetical protein GGR55DRAFT_95571 [Xylaria sp. FL0064]|nr:hypothetical protein GGR55DRAFT_95571 [Xylaria sp. FL0064]